jgi:hypothetical protein
MRQWRRDCRRCSSTKSRTLPQRRPALSCAGYSPQWTMNSHPLDPCCPRLATPEAAPGPTFLARLEPGAEAQQKQQQVSSDSASAATPMHSTTKGTPALRQNVCQLQGCGGRFQMRGFRVVLWRRRCGGDANVRGNTARCDSGWGNDSRSGTRSNGAMCRGPWLTRRRRPGWIGPWWCTRTGPSSWKGEGEGGTKGRGAGVIRGARGMRRKEGNAVLKRWQGSAQWPGEEVQAACLSRRSSVSGRSDARPAGVDVYSWKVRVSRRRVVCTAGRLARCACTHSPPLGVTVFTKPATMNAAG